MVKPREHLFFNNLPDFEKEAEEEKRLRKLPKSPSFSLDDMDDARKASYNKGHADGLQNAKDSIEQQTEIIVQSLSDHIRELEDAEIARHDHAIENAVSISEKAMRHLLPALLDQNAKTLIKESLDNFFSDNTPKSNLALFVNPVMIDSMTKHVENLSATIQLKADDKLSLTQAKLEWVDGNFEFKPDQMIETILKIIKDKLPNDTETLDDSSKKTHTEQINTNQQDPKTHE